LQPALLQLLCRQPPRLPRHEKPPASSWRNSLHPSVSSLKGIRREPVVEAVGTCVLYLPTYSPDFNPIELWWADLLQLNCPGVRAAPSRSRCSNRRTRRLSNRSTYPRDDIGRSSNRTRDRCARPPWCGRHHCRASSRKRPPGSRRWPGWR
ncbi:hypothetical protein D7V80_13100, partial [Corallococcus sp. CA054B]